MTGSMIERVTKALKAEFEPYRVFDEGEAERLARAAIEAMREPTEAMKKLDSRYALYWDHSTAPPRLSFPLGAHVGAHWAAMIDEALK